MNMKGIGRSTLRPYGVALTPKGGRVKPVRRMITGQDGYVGA